MGLLLSIRTAERFGSTPRRSTQPRASRCRSEGGGVDDSRHQVRQDSSGAFARIDLHGACRLHRQTSATLGRTSGVFLLFVSSWGNRLDEGDIHRTFYALSRQIGLRGTSDSRGPRLHDMRHRFATNTLVQWYRSGQDPERRLPLLSTYLGHVHVSDTQWYLEGSPELMREAMQRLQERWEDRP